jgi:hypothetical protein
VVQGLFPADRALDLTGHRILNLFHLNRYFFGEIDQSILRTYHIVFNADTQFFFWNVNTGLLNQKYTSEYLTS